MTQDKRFEAIADISDNPHAPPKYARIEHRGKSEWKTFRTAKKHAREYKARHMRDAWAQEV